MDRQLRSFITGLGVVFALLMGVTNPLQAKDLTTRLGIGYRDQFAVGLPSIAVQYYPNPKLGLGAALGVDTESDRSRFGVSVKVARIIYMETNLNFYMGTSVALISTSVSSGKNESGFELNGIIGCEYFFAGLENLGFTFETGVGVRSISSGVNFRTFGDHPIKGGIIFYF